MWFCIRFHNFTIFDSHKNIVKHQAYLLHAWVNTDVSEQEWKDRFFIDVGAIKWPNTIMRFDSLRLETVYALMIWHKMGGGGGGVSILGWKSIKYSKKYNLRITKTEQWIKGNSLLKWK